MANLTYHWIQDDESHPSARRCKACHHREKKFKYFMFVCYGAQADQGWRVHSQRGLTLRRVFSHNS